MPLPRRPIDMSDANESSAPVSFSVGPAYWPSIGVRTSDVPCIVPEGEREIGFGLAWCAFQS